MLKLPNYNNCPNCGTAVELIQREGRERHVCPSCDFVIYVNPIPAVTAAYRRILESKPNLPTMDNTQPEPAVRLRCVGKRLFLGVRVVSRTASTVQVSGEGERWGTFSVLGGWVSASVDLVSG